MTQAGCRVVLPTTSVAAALSTLVHYAIDAAVLDVNIQNEWVFPVAHALAAAGVPFLFLTAYALDSIPAEHRGRPFIRKPHIPEALLAAIEAMAIAPGDRPQAANDETSQAGPKTA